jgi:hypothetical protein
MTKTHQLLGRQIPIAPTAEQAGVSSRMCPLCSTRSGYAEQVQASRSVSPEHDSLALAQTGEVH